MKQEWITPQQASEKWGVTARHIRALCARNQIAGATRIGKEWFIPQNSPRPVFDILAGSLTDNPEQKGIVQKTASKKKSMISQPVSKDSDLIVQLLIKEKIEVIDKRDENGVVWAVLGADGGGILEKIFSRSGVKRYSYIFEQPRKNKNSMSFSAWKIVVH